MRTFVEAATGLPGILFTAVLVVAGCFRLLVDVGAVTVDSFDADAGLAAWRLTCLFVRPSHRLFPDEPGPPADHRRYRRRTHR